MFNLLMTFERLKNKACFVFYPRLPTILTSVTWQGNKKAWFRDNTFNLQSFESGFFEVFIFKVFNFRIRF